jgi:hypothetical protein
MFWAINAAQILLYLNHSKINNRCDIQTRTHKFNSTVLSLVLKDLSKFKSEQRRVQDFFYQWYGESLKTIHCCLSLIPLFFLSFFFLLGAEKKERDERQTPVNRFLRIHPGAGSIFRGVEIFSSEGRE